MENILITDKEFAKLMKVTPMTIRTWVRRKKIPNEIIFKLPDTTKGTTRFIKDRVIQWITGGFVE